MSQRLSLLPLLTCLVACAPALEASEATPTGKSTTPATIDTGDAPPATVPGDTGDPPDSGTEEVETVPPGTAMPQLSPPAGLFADSLTVSLSSSADIGETYACVGVPSSTCTLEPASSLTLDGPGVVYARVDIDGIPGPLTATPYVKVNAEVLTFSSNLPVMVAWSNEARDDLWTNSPMVLLTFDSPDGRTTLDGPAELSSRMRLRIRGSSSSGLSKKNYDMELWRADSSEDQPASMFDMPADADWVLHGPSYFDDALIRNALGYQLSRDMERYAPRTAFSEMFLLTSARTLTLSDYVGMYSVTEEIERGSDRVNVARLDEDDTVWPEVSGGYVFKRDREGESGEGIWAGDGGGAFQFWDPIVPVDPEAADLEREQEAYLEAELNALGYALAATDGADPASGRAWQDIVDVDSFIDHHILAVLVKNPDAFRLSGYFHKDREAPIVAGPIWDLDRTAGSIDSRARDPYRWDATNETSDTTPIFTYGWYGPMFADPDFRVRYWARWQELLDGPLAPAAVQAHIDAMAAELSEAGPRNNTRWSAPSWNGEISHISDWYAARLSWIATCIDTLDDPRTCAGAHAAP